MTDSSHDYQAVACGLYDYIELACIHHCRVRVSLGSESDGRMPEPQEYVGVARTTQTLRGDGEYLLLDMDGQTQSIRLDYIATLEPLDEVAGFGKIRFR